MMAAKAGAAVRVQSHRGLREDPEALRSRLIRETAPFFDLEERLRVVPPSARGRGVYLRSIESAVQEAGLLDTYMSIYPGRSAIFGWHPVTEILERMTVGAALLKGPERVNEGLWLIGHHNAIEFAKSLLGRMMFRLLSRDPQKLLQQAAAGRRQSMTSGTMWVEFPHPGKAIMHLQEEYAPIESYCLGGAVGTFDAIGMEARIECELDDRFNGRHIFTWEP